MKGMCENCPKRKDCTELCALAEIYVNQDYMRQHEKLVQKHLDLVGEEHYRDAWEIIGGSLKPDWHRIRVLGKINQRWGKSERLLSKLEFKCLFFRYARKMSLQEIGEKTGTTKDVVDIALKRAIQKLGKRYRHFFPRNHQRIT